MKKFNIEIEETTPGYYRFSLKQTGKRKPVLSGADTVLPRIMASVTVQMEAIVEADIRQQLDLVSAALDAETDDPEEYARLALRQLQLDSALQALSR